MEERVMKKSAIKNFAVTARRKLIDAVKQKAYELGIIENEIKEPEIFENEFRINQKFFKKYELKQREKLIEKINEKGYEQVIEEVAYTWFNRFIAIRFMEVNEYLPTGVRVLSSIEQGKMEPDAVTEVLSIADDLGLDLELVYRLQDENNTEGLFKYILVRQCNKLGEIMPMVFEQIEDYTELLLPDNLLVEGSVIRDLVSMIEEDDWKEQVEIIGWLYQEYISEKKAEIDEKVKKGKKVEKEELPAKTQLFTQKWIVKYMVENSLGKLWLGAHPDHELRTQLNYLVEDVEQDIGIEEQIRNLRDKNLEPKDIKILDPCMGSGHILTYAFDILYKIYQYAGYSEHEIPTLILEKNLYGLEIDNRAAQLAYFAVMMKARSYDKRIFRKHIELNLYSIRESKSIPKEAIDYFVGDTLNKGEVEYLINVFKDAKEYCAMLDIAPIDFTSLEDRIREIKEKKDIEDIFSLQYADIVMEEIAPIIHQAKIMSQKYDIVITNPPYLGRKSMNANLTAFIDKNFPKSKMELYAVFIEVCLRYAKETSYVSLVTRDSWMFTSSFEELRESILRNYLIESMIHLGPHAFEEIKGEVVTTTTFVIKKGLSEHLDEHKGIYYRLVDIKNALEKENYFLLNKNLNFKFKQKDFGQIIGSPLCYWINDSVKKCFLNTETFNQIAKPKKGLDTNGDSELYFRKWFEININDMFLDENQPRQKYKWFEIDMGGDFRKWYGNRMEVINYENDGFTIKNKKKKPNIRNEKYYFKNSLTYGVISSKKISFRVSHKTSLFYQHGANCFPADINRLYILALGNSKVANELLSYIAPTLTFTVGDIAKLPVIIPPTDVKNRIETLVKRNIQISKQDWDSFETSWDFKKPPLLTYKKEAKTIEQAFNNWSSFAEQQFYKLKENEEELNRIFIEIYGLQDELTPEVDEKDVTVRKADKERDIKSFISYAVGCMFGRYSLDQEGLVFAGGEFNESKYVTYKADPDNVIPITDDEYFEDDIVSRFVEFVRVTFGEETLEENLDFIADALTRKANETSRQRIRRYFLKEFYKDHVQTYQKRPIYWLFDSGKNDGFKALIYMHRYDEGTVAKVRTDYLHLLQRKYEAEIKRLEMIMDSDVSTAEKTKVRKKKEKIQKQLLECMQYDQVMAHVANQKISIDLDDGVKVNYAKFQGIKVPQGEGKKPLVMDLLAKI